MRKKMSVRHALLGLISQRPRHGYELRAALEALVGGQQNWDLKASQVYTTLTRLQEGGLISEQAVEQDGGPERRIYAITPAGRAVLAEWLTTPVATTPQRDELYLKLVLSLVSEGADAHGLIYAQRSSLYRALHALTAQRAQADPKRDLARILLLDQAVMHVEADLRWLDMVEARMDDVARQPLPEPVSRPRGRPPKSDPSLWR
jgi:DNA-binding PadR family transcriptional regulator